MNTDIIKALKSLGYRQIDKSCFGKPIGFNLFIYNIDKSTIFQYFLSVDKTSHIYNYEKIVFNNYEDFLYDLKVFESNVFQNRNNSDFEFLTITYKLEL